MRLLRAAGVPSACGAQGQLLLPLRPQRRHAAVLGKINPIPMPRKVAALQLAIQQRAAWLMRKAEKSEAEAPPFDRDALLEHLDHIWLRTKKEREAAEVLRSLLGTHTTVCVAITHTRSTFRVGLRALRRSGDHDSVISWIVGHYLCSTINRVELTAYGLSTALRKYALLIAASAALAAAVAYSVKDEVRKVPQAVAGVVDKAAVVAAEAGIIDALPASPAQPCPATQADPSFPSKRYTKGEHELGAVVGYAAPTAIATFVFGIPGAYIAASVCGAVFLIYSVELKPEERSTAQRIQRTVFGA